SAQQVEGVDPKGIVNDRQSQLFEAYLYCSSKCWLLSRTEPAAANAYAEWARAQNKAYCEGGLNRLLAIVPESERAIAPPITKNLRDANGRFAVDVPVRSHDLESRLHAVERIPLGVRGRAPQFTPYRFEFTNKIARDHKLLIAFDAFVLSEAL